MLGGGRAPDKADGGGMDAASAAEQGCEGLCGLPPRGGHAALSVAVCSKTPSASLGGAPRQDGGREAGREQNA